MAKKLYDYWFVQFEAYPKDNMGRKIGMKKIALSSVLTYNGGSQPPASQFVFSEKEGYIRFVQTRDYYTDNHITYIPISKNNKLCNEKDIMLARYGASLGRICYGLNGAYNVALAKITPKKDYYREFLRCYLMSDLFYKTINGIGGRCAQAGFNQNDIDLINIYFPENDEIVKRFETIVAPIFELQLSNLKQTRSLINLRNRLLPLLMNGQVTVKPQVNCDLSNKLTLQKKMKKEFIHKVLDAVSFLDKEQVRLLNAVLEKELQNVELVRSIDEKGRIEFDNNSLLNSFISAKRIEGCSEKTLKYYENTITKFFSTISIRATEADTNIVREYLAQYQEKQHSSKVTIDNMRRIFSTFYAWLEDEDYIIKSPVRRIHKVRTDTLVKEVLTDEELEQLRDNCTNQRDLAMIDLLASTGIRVGELVKMNRTDIDFNERQCVVFGKGNKEREVYFNARTKLHLQKYLESRTDNNPALFVSLDAPYTRLNISGVEVRLRRLGSLCNIHKVHPHKFRRTLATMAIDKGMPIEQVQRLLGHCKIDTTLHYAMVNQNNVKIAHRRFIP